MEYDDNRNTTAAFTRVSDVMITEWMGVVGRMRITITLISKWISRLALPKWVAVVIRSWI